MRLILSELKMWYLFIFNSLQRIELEELAHALLISF